MNLAADAVGYTLTVMVMVAFVVGIHGYRLGLRKSQRPKSVAVISGLLAFVFPLALVYLLWLQRRPDLKEPDLPEPKDDLPHPT